MRIPAEEPSGGQTVQDSESVIKSRRILFFNTSRADLGLTLIIAAALALFTLILFKFDGDVRLFTYNSSFREASCTILDKHLEHVSESRGPVTDPDIGIPPRDKWRGAIHVRVDAEGSNRVFDGTAYDTIQGAFDEVVEYQQEFLDSHPVGKLFTCYYGPYEDHTAIVFDVESALAPVKGGWYGLHRSFGMDVAKMVVGFFALLFLILVLLKLCMGTWDEPSVYSSDSWGGGQGGDTERNSLLGPVSGKPILTGQPPRYVVDLQADAPGNTYAQPQQMDLRAGTPGDTPRSTGADSFEELNLRGNRR